MFGPWRTLLGPSGGISEGPVWDGVRLLFTRIFESRILAYEPASGQIRVVHEGTECANGLCLDLAGNLLACQGGATPAGRAVVRYEADGRRTVLASHFLGRSLNMPNDVVVDPLGRVWFTDPFYEGAAGEWSTDRRSMELDHESVYRLDPLGSGGYAIARVTFTTTRPNGLVFSPDFSRLYVAQSGRRPEEQRQLLRYRVLGDGSLEGPEVLYDFGPHRGIDGMRMAEDGCIVATAGWTDSGPGPRLVVFDPDGGVLFEHPVPAQKPTNCAFAGVDLGTLFVTTTEGHLLATETGLRGLRPETQLRK